MKIYYIRTFAHEDKPDCTIGYCYNEFIQVKKSLDNRGIPYASWSEYVYEDMGIE